jgi:hypothetical protein
MSTQGQGQTITFAPACIGTSIVDEEYKLRHLREELEDESYQFQRKNIEFLIHYYENGGKVPAPGQTIWLLDGKVVDKEPEEIPEGSIVWAEEVCLPSTLTHPITLYLHVLRPRAICEGLPGVYSTIWCLCYKTNKLKKRRNRRRGAGPVYVG